MYSVKVQYLYTFQNDRHRSLVNICHHTVTKFCFLWWKLLRYTLLVIFKYTVQYVNYSYQAVHYMLWFTYFKAGNLYLLTPFTRSCTPSHCSTSGSHQSVFCIYELAFFVFLINLFIYLFLFVLGLRFCAKAFSSCGKRGPLTVAASPAVEHRLQTRMLSSCGSWAQPLRGMWDLPGPGHEPMFPALAGGFLTPAPPGKPFFVF